MKFALLVSFAEPIKLSAFNDNCRGSFPLSGIMRAERNCWLFLRFGAELMWAKQRKIPLRAQNSAWWKIGLTSSSPSAFDAIIRSIIGFASFIIYLALSWRRDQNGWPTLPNQYSRQILKKHGELCINSLLNWFQSNGQLTSDSLGWKPRSCSRLMKIARFSTVSLYNLLKMIVCDYVCGVLHSIVFHSILPFSKSGTT